TWHVPQAHFLEQWSDARGHDGTLSIVQPLIAPLHGGVSAHELLAMLEGEAARSPRDLLREGLRSWLPGGDFEESWRGVLREGVVPDSASPHLAVNARAVEFAAAPPVEGWSVAFRGDPSVHDGAFANNA